VARGSNSEGGGRRRAARHPGELERGDVAAGLCSFGLALFELNFLQIFE
jgi:hypothetical protein